MNSLADILTAVSTVITAWFGWIPDIFDLVASNPWIYIMVILPIAGFMISGALRVIRGAKKAVRK